MSRKKKYCIEEVPEEIEVLMPDYYKNQAEEKYIYRYHKPQFKYLTKREDKLKK